jgi:ketosteroid isomerase-like protein
MTDTLLYGRVDGSIAGQPNDWSDEMDDIHAEAFANRLMDRVWRRLDSTELADFYQLDVVGHHDSPRGSDQLGFDDVRHRLDWDREHFADPAYDVADLLVGVDRFAMRFHYSATLISTGERYQSEAAYFYHLRAGKISEFWLLANVDFDYKE